MRLGDAYPKNQPSTGGISGVAGWEEGELGAGALPVCLYIRKDGWAEQGCEPHQEVAVQSAGSSTDGLATRVLWRMLMTGRALQRKPTGVSPPAGLRPGQAGLKLGRPWWRGWMEPGLPADGAGGEEAPIHRRLGSPQQHDAVRQAPHEQVGVEVLVHVHLPAQGVAEGGQAREPQLLSVDYLGAEEALETSWRVGSGGGGGGTGE